MGALRVTVALSPIGVNVFGSDSKKASAVATIHDFHGEDGDLEFARKLFAGHVVVDWPFLRQAKVVSIASQNARYHQFVVVAAAFAQTNV